METLFNEQDLNGLTERSRRTCVVYHNHPLPNGCDPDHADIGIETTGRHAMLHIPRGIQYYGNRRDVSEWVSIGTKTFSCGVSECVGWLRHSLKSARSGEFCVKCGDYLPYYDSLHDSELVCPNCQFRRGFLPPFGPVFGPDKLCLACHDIFELRVHVKYCPKCGGGPIVCLQEAVNLLRVHIPELDRCNCFPAGRFDGPDFPAWLEVGLARQP